MRATILLAACVLCACGGPEEPATTEVSMVVHVPCVRPPCSAGSEEPVAAGPLTGRPAPVMLAVGWDHSCALDREGAVWCWGSNTADQLGDIHEDQSPIPSRVPSIPPMAAVWAGANQTCGRARDDGQLWCWGETGLGAAREPVFAQSLPFTNVRTVGLAYRKGCFITEDGALYCWGDYGRPHGPIWDSPRRVPLEGAVAVHGSMNRHCAVTARGAITCWGMHPAYTFVERLGDPLWALPDLRSVTLFAIDSFAPHPTPWVADARGRVFEATPTGRNDSRQGTRHLALRELPGLADVVELDAAGHVCARTSGGTAACWGINNAGQVGDGTTATRAEPVVLTLTEVEEIAVGKAHTCARAHGALYCWGDNRSGQLGVQGVRDAHEPVEVPW